MLTQDLRALTIEQLENELLSLKREQFNLRIKKQKSAGQTSKGHLFPQVRRKIAQIKTLLTEKKRVEV